MRALPLACLILLAPLPALAHPGHGGDGGFLAGLGHPLLGPDHLLAMVAVGLWAALAGGRAVWAFPLAFLSGMAVGGLLGIGGAEVAAVEPAILASVVLIGAAAAALLRVPLAAAATVLAAFGLAHGYAHGIEGPAGPVGAYAAGFLLATAALHLGGIALARLGRLPARLMGGGVALAGVALAVAA